MKEVEKKIGGSGARLDIVDMSDLIVVFSEKRSNNLN